MKILINSLTLFRLFAGLIIFILIINQNYIFALFLFFLASLTDYFDGYLARKYNMESTFGEILDPVADKVLIIFVIFGLSAQLLSPLFNFFASIIISREIIVSSLRDFNSRNNRSDRTSVISLSKIKTAIQFFALSIYILALYISFNLLIVVGDILFFISALITVYTGFKYFQQTFADD